MTRPTTGVIEKLVTVSCGAKVPRISTLAGGRPISSWASRSAVSIRSASVSSCLPPGKAICPGWCLSAEDRLVRIRSYPSGPAIIGARTAAGRSLRPGGRCTSLFRSKSDDAAPVCSSAARVRASRSFTCCGFRLKTNRFWIQIVMCAAELTIRRYAPFIRCHRCDISRGIDREALTHPIFGTCAPKPNRLRVKNARCFLMEQAKQQVTWGQLRADQFQLFDCIQQDVNTIPIFGCVAVQQIARRNQIACAFNFGHQRRRLGHVLQHHATRPPMLGDAGFLRSAKTQLKARWQLLGLGKIRLCTGRQRPTIQRRNALIGLHALTLVDHNGKVSFTNLIKRGLVRQTICVIAGIGSDPSNITLFFGAIIIGGNHPHSAF
mmetsp:Transcript_18032/g.27531  ORF Transcript_18032/g.27531 Transcript_18032/m.27531 type:complete len:378 (+) Transcript_18032:557-1690(+)